MKNLKVMLNENFFETKICIKSANKVNFINFKDILYLQSDGAYCTIYLFGGKKITCTKSLKYFENILTNRSFFRISKSALINFNMISEYRKDIGFGQVTLINGKILNISRRKKGLFNQIIKKL